MEIPGPSRTGRTAAATSSAVPVFLAASLRQVAARASAHHNRHAPERLQGLIHGRLSLDGLVQGIFLQESHRFNGKIYGFL